MDNGGVLHVHKHIFHFHFHPSLSPIISLQKTMFDPKTEEANINLHTLNPLEPINGSYGAVNFGSKPQKAAQNYEKYRNWNGGGLQFRPENIGEDESGVCSPPLWGNKSPSRSPIHSPKSGGDNYFPHGLSPSSRSQAIARGQLELMEMVKAMPESSYELSLKDLVEFHSHRVEIPIQNQKECLVEEESLSNKASVKRQESAKKIEKKGKMMRSGSNINENKGLFLKMVFPITLGGRKKKKKANPYAKVSPKPDGNNSDNKASKVVEKEWWKKRLTSISDESTESGGISSNSGSTGSSGSSGSSVSSRSTRCNSTRRRKNGCLRVFLPFYSKKSLPAK